MLLSLIAESVYDTDDAPALTSDSPSSDSLTLADEPYDTLAITGLPGMQDVAEQAYFEATPYELELEHAISPMPDISPNWNSQRVNSEHTGDSASNELDYAYKDAYSSGSASTSSHSVLEPSPTLRLIAQFAKSRPRQERERSLENIPVSVCLTHSRMRITI